MILYVDVFACFWDCEYNDSSYFWIYFFHWIFFSQPFGGSEEDRVDFLKDALKWDEIEGLMAKVKNSFLGITDSLKSA